jgi:large subunit ribosomal protein L9
MEIILKETIDTLGQEGDVVKVKPGYARNFLIPKKKAVLANKSNLSLLKQEQEFIKSRLEKQKQEAMSLSEKISGVTVTITRLAGEEERLFGSVTSSDIAEALEKNGVTIDKRAIIIKEPIKTIGEHLVQVKVGYQMAGDITVQVVAEGTEK